MSESMPSLPPCSDAPGLERWLRQALAPYYVVNDGPLVREPLIDVSGGIPILQEPVGAVCVWSGRVGAVACWELHDERGDLVARAASAPRFNLTVPDRIVKLHPYAYHQS